MHLALWYVVLVCHQYDVSEYSVGSVYVGGYGGLSESGLYVHISGEDWVWYVRDVLYAVLYVCVSCFVVRGCGVSRRYIDVCHCDMFSVVNVHLDHFNLCVVCINSRRYVC